MSLLEDIAAEVKANGPRCSFPALLETMPDDLRADLLAAVADRRYQVPAIVRAMQKRGYEVTKNLIERHRHDECKSCRS